VPTLVLYFMRGRNALQAPKGFFGRFQAGFERRFAQFRDWYVGKLESALWMRWKFVLVFLGICLFSLGLLSTIGQDFFPTVDAGQFRLHLRARTGTRIEETANDADKVEEFIRTQIPKDELETILKNIGLPYSGIHTSYANNGTIGTADVEILCALNEQHHGPTAG
jgi:multidrug efflux pump subunit AcrB